MKHRFKITGLIIFAISVVLANERDLVASPNVVNKKIDSEVNEDISFMSIYENILQSNCALSNCHDGNFEPDFTSPQSAYYTTVWHGVKKNSMDYSFQFRVYPYDTTASLLYERITNCCFNNEEDRMPLLMGSLTHAQIDSIALWIMSGAPDIYGEYPYQEYEKE